MTKAEIEEHIAEIEDRLAAVSPGSGEAITLEACLHDLTEELDELDELEAETI